MDLHPLTDFLPAETDSIFELARLPEIMNIASDKNPSLFHRSPGIQNVNRLISEWETDGYFCSLEPPNAAVRVYDQDNTDILSLGISSQFIADSKNTAVALNGRPIFDNDNFATKYTVQHAVALQTDSIYGLPVNSTASSVVESGTSSLFYGPPAVAVSSALDNRPTLESPVRRPLVSYEFNHESCVDDIMNRYSPSSLVNGTAAYPASVVESGTSSLFYGPPAVTVSSALDNRPTRESPVRRPLVSYEFNHESCVDDIMNRYSPTSLVNGTPAYHASVVESETSRNDLFYGPPAVVVSSALPDRASENDGAFRNDEASSTSAVSVFDSEVGSDSVLVVSNCPAATSRSNSIVTAKKRKPKQKKDEKIKLALDKKHNKYAVKEPCKCKKNCLQKISFERQSEINKQFWELDYIGQKLYIRSKTTKPSLKPTARNPVKYFFTTASDQTVEVCQIFFLATLGFKPNNNTVVRDALKHEFPRPDGRGKNLNKWKFDESIVVDHILSFNPETSHYRREHAPFRKYLPSDVTITKMHQLFMEQQSNMSCSYDYYRKVIDKLNISFTKLGHEKCEQCELHEQHSHTSPVCQQCIEHDQHKQFYIQARIQYDADKIIPDDPQNIIVSVDMEKVVMLPRMEQFKEVLFTKRICAFNETFAPVGGSLTLPVFASVWHEGIAGRKKEELISCFRSFLVYHRNASTITFWSDNCTAQNKCWALFCFMVYIVNSDEIAAESITMKFLEKGHTFMSADSFHHQVELAMKHSDKGNVYDFNDFVKCVQSSNGQRVVCKELQFSDFADWPDWTSVSKLNKAKPRPYIAKMSKIKFVRGKKTMLYANSFEDEWIELDFIMAKHQGLVPPAMRTSTSGISEEVKCGITRKLTQLMPLNRRTFWLEIPTKGQTH